MSRITTHVLDSVMGKPAEGVMVKLETKAMDGWHGLSSGVTNADGRCTDLAPEVSDGIYRLTFETGAYLSRNGRGGIYPEISVIFTCDGKTHYHLPLLLSDNGYTTYRGS
jgi:5-hydroxyisourate hydrolase